MMERNDNDGLISRRKMMGVGVGALGAVALGSVAQAADVEKKGKGKRGAKGDGELKSKYTQGAALWCYKKKTPLPELFAASKKIGLVGWDLVNPKDWPALKEAGLVCTMTPSGKLRVGLSHTENHESELKSMRDAIDQTSAAGWKNVICFSGNRNGMPDDVGLENTIKALKSVAGYAEKKKVTICLEFLNSINHKDYMGDSTEWCVAMVKGVGSERVKVLYDIYHAGMMKEDPVADITKHHECWGHYHTAGIPGRNDIDNTQTLDYPAIMRAIAKTGYDRYVVHEFRPKGEVIPALEAAIKICTV